MSLDLEQRIETLARGMFEFERLVVFTGAGISTDSGLPDFRDQAVSGHGRPRGFPQKPGLSIRRSLTWDIWLSLSYKS